MKKAFLTAVVCALLSTAAHAAERFVAITHDNGVTQWWAPMIKGAKDAAKDSDGGSGSGGGASNEMPSRCAVRCNASSFS